MNKRVYFFTSYATPCQRMLQRPDVYRRSEGNLDKFTEEKSLEGCCTQRCKFWFRVILACELMDVGRVEWGNTTLYLSC